MEFMAWHGVHGRLQLSTGEQGTPKAFSCVPTAEAAPRY